MDAMAMATAKSFSRLALPSDRPAAGTDIKMSMVTLRLVYENVSIIPADGWPIAIREMTKSRRTDRRLPLSVGTNGSPPLASASVQGVCAAKKAATRFM
jgi:hypothetical protein